MTHRFASQEATARRLIRDNGAAALIVTRGAPTGDAFNPTPGADTSAECRAVLLDYRAREIDGTLIRMSDRKALVSTEGVDAAPTVNDRFAVGGQNYEIVSVKTLSPADVPVIWTLQLRL